MDCFGLGDERDVKLFRNNRIIAGGTGGSLVILFLLLSLGARSVDFHWLLHGDEVECLLTYHSACHPVEERDSEPESPPPDRDAPLDSFCHAGFWAGFWHSIQAAELVLEHLLPVDLSCLFSILFEGRVRFSDGPPRAPPVLV